VDTVVPPTVPDAAYCGVSPVAAPRTIVTVATTAPSTAQPVAVGRTRATVITVEAPVVVADTGETAHGVPGADRRIAAAPEGLVAPRPAQATAYALAAGRVGGALLLLTLPVRDFGLRATASDGRDRVVPCAISALCPKNLYHVAACPAPVNVAPAALVLCIALGATPRPVRGYTAISAAATPVPARAAPTATVRAGPVQVRNCAKQSSAQIVDVAATANVEGTSSVYLIPKQVAGHVGPGIAFALVTRNNVP